VTEDNVTTGTNNTAVSSGKQPDSNVSCGNTSTDNRMKWSEAVLVIDAVIEGFIEESDMSDSMINLIDKAWERIQQG
jgi:hypothetical protein